MDSRPAFNQNRLGEGNDNPDRHLQLKRPGMKTRPLGGVRVGIGRISALNRLQRLDPTRFIRFVRVRSVHSGSRQSRPQPSLQDHVVRLSEGEPMTRRRTGNRRRRLQRESKDDYLETTTTSLHQTTDTTDCYDWGLMALT